MTPKQKWEALMALLHPDKCVCEKCGHEHVAKQPPILELSEQEIKELLNLNGEPEKK